MIYPHRDGTFSISSHGMWLPGCYASHGAANFAFRKSGADLEALQNRKNEEAGGTGGVITFADVQALPPLAKKRSDRLFLDGGPSR